MKDKFQRAALYVRQADKKKLMAAIFTATVVPGGLIAILTGVLISKYDVKNKIQKRYRAFKARN